jgi:hypothetical protein
VRAQVCSQIGPACTPGAKSTRPQRYRLPLMSIHVGCISSRGRSPKTEALTAGCGQPYRSELVHQCTQRGCRGRSQVCVLRLFQPIDRVGRGQLLQSWMRGARISGDCTAFFHVVMHPGVGWGGGRALAFGVAQRVRTHILLRCMHPAFAAACCSSLTDGGALALPRPCLQLTSGPSVGWVVSSTGWGGDSERQ